MGEPAHAPQTTDRRPDRRQWWAAASAPLCFLAIVILWHCWMNTDWGDSTTFQSYVIDAGGDLWAMLPDYMVMHFLSINSRFLVAGVEVAFSWWPPIVFCIFDVAFWMLIWWDLYRLIGMRWTASHTWLITAVLSAVRLPDLSSAGWIATCINYVWTVALALYVFVCVADVLRGRRLSVVKIILMTLACIYAANLEQLSLILTVGIALIILYLIFVDRRPVRAWWQLLIPLVVAAIILVVEIFGPGNSARFVNESRVWMPYFPEKSVISKIDTSIVIFVNHVLIAFNLIIFGLALLAMVNASRTTEITAGADGRHRVGNFVRRLVYVFAFVGYCCASVLQWMVGSLQLLFKPLVDLEDQLYGFSWHPLAALFDSAGPFDGTSIVNLLRTLLYIAILCALAYTIWRSFERRRDALVALLVIGLGFMGAMVTGFSPTANASFMRTMFVFYVAAMVVVLWGCTRGPSRVSSSPLTVPLCIGISIALLVGAYGIP